MLLSAWKKLAFNRFNSSNSPCICRVIRSSLQNNYSTTVSTPMGPPATDSTVSEDYFHEQVDEKYVKSKKSSVLDELPVLEDLSHVGPPISYKSFNFAAYANDSVVLQKLIDLGVDFYYIERSNKKIPSYLLQLNFDRHVQPYIQFLLDKKIPIENLGVFFSKNPFFFQNNLDDLHVRVNYLQSKKFTEKAITDMIIKNPLLLNFTTVAVDCRLGFFQRTFFFNGSEVRHLATKYPLVITRPMHLLSPIVTELKSLSGFSRDECKSIILQQPYILKLELESLKSRLEFMRIDMNLPLSLIASDPSGLVNRTMRLKERHLFLKSLGKAQYDPSLPQYVSINNITHGDDASFCQFVAKTSVETYNLFLKTL